MERNRFQRELEKIKQQDTWRSLREISSPQGNSIVCAGRAYHNFASNNYLGLANDPRLEEAFIRGVQDYGVGSGAARLINGSLKPFHDLEKILAEWKGTEAALLFNSGYHANVGALSALLSEDDVIFSDELNHASIIDGYRF